MVTERLLQKMILPVKRKILNSIGRACITAVSDELNRQNVQVKIHADESADDIERFQNYGFTSNPPLSAEAVVLALGGDLSQLVALAVEDKSCRPKNSESGDVILYHQEGHEIRLTKSGKLVITATDVIYNASNSFTIISPQTLVDGPLHVTGGISTDLGIYAQGAIASDTNLTAKGVNYLGHRHYEHDSETTSTPIGA